MKKGLADDGHIINGFSGLELICSDHCSLKGSSFLEAIDASTSHKPPSESPLGPSFLYSKINKRSSPCSLYNSLQPQNSAALPINFYWSEDVLS